MARPSTSSSYDVKTRLEYIAVWTLFRILGFCPRHLGRRVGHLIGWFASVVLRRLWWTGLQNLSLAFPLWSADQRRQTLRGVFKNLGNLLAEFCLMPGYSGEDAEAMLRYDGLEEYVAAVAKGRGVLILTGHLGAWELSSFLHSLMGFPMSLVIRHLDNPLVDALVNKIRCLHGNRVISKDEFARGLITAMRAGETVGILMDTNMTPPQGIFVPFFGVPACTASGLARVALKTGAAVLPGFLLREKGGSRYVLRFGEELDLIRSADLQADIAANTALFTRVIEEYVRKYPDQWLWMHRRWKTRPAGEAGIYP